MHGIFILICTTKIHSGAEVVCKSKMERKNLLEILSRRISGPEISLSTFKSVKLFAR